MKQFFYVTSKMPYLTQRDNAVNPTRSCNTTSMVQALMLIPTLWKKFTKSKEYKKYSKNFSQPEDCLQQYMLDSGLRPTYHAELSQAVNAFLGSTNATVFDMNVSLSNIASDIKNGLPVVISGDFPRSSQGTMGHIVTLIGVGYEDTQNIDEDLPAYWIINDPYGNTLNNWQGLGQHVILTREYVLRNIKNLNSNKKWAHRFIRK